MKILYHHRTQGKGVEAIHIMGVVDGLRALGHHVEVAGPPMTDPEKSVLRTQKSETGGSVWKSLSKYCPEILFEFMEILYNLYAFFRLTWIIKHRPPAVIYERYALFQFGGLLAARLNHCPIILEVNDASGIERVRSLTMRKLAKSLEKVIFRSSDLLLTISNVFTRYIQSFEIDDRRVIAIPNAVSSSFFDMDPSKRSQIRKEYRIVSKLVIGFVGLFVPWHGLPFLLRTFKRLAEKHASIHLLIVGDGPEKKAIIDEIQHVDIKNRVTLTGYVNHDRIASLISAFDIAVMPDSNAYGSPMKIFEYMGMAKAIVAPSYQPIEEVLSHGRNALLFSPKNAQAMEDMLETLILNRDLLSELGKKARSDALKYHTWENRAVQVESEVLNILAKRHLEHATHRKGKLV